MNIHLRNFSYLKCWHKNKENQPILIIFAVRFKCFYKMTKVLLATLIAFLSVASLSAQTVRDRNNMKIGTANGVNMYHTAVYYFFNLL